MRDFFTAAWILVLAATTAAAQETLVPAGVRWGRCSASTTWWSGNSACAGARRMSWAKSCPTPIHSPWAPSAASSSRRSTTAGSTREHSHSTQLCTTNPEVVDKLRSYLDAAKEEANTEPVVKRIAALRDAFDRCEASIRRLEKS